MSKGISETKQMSDTQVPVPKDYAVQEVWGVFGRLGRGHPGELIAAVFSTTIVVFVILAVLTMVIAIKSGIPGKSINVGIFQAIAGVALLLGICAAGKYYSTLSTEPRKIRISFAEGTVTFENFFIDTRSFFPAPYMPRAVFPFKDLTEVFRHYGRQGGYIMLQCPKGKIVIPGSSFTREELDRLSEVLLLATTGKRSPA